MASADRSRGRCLRPRAGDRLFDNLAGVSARPQACDRMMIAHRFARPGLVSRSGDELTKAFDRGKDRVRLWRSHERPRPLPRWTGMIKPFAGRDAGRQADGSNRLTHLPNALKHSTPTLWPLSASQKSRRTPHFSIVRPAARAESIGT